MKKKIFTSVCFLAGFSIIIYAISAGGSQSDSLGTKSSIDTLFEHETEQYLNNILTPYENPIETYVGDIIEKDLDRTKFYKDEDISLSFGSSIIIRDGSHSISGTGSLINVSNGTEIKNPVNLSVGTKYIVAENSNFTVTVTSDSMNAYIEGTLVTYYDKSEQYLKYADALFDLGLLLGDNGEYMLERESTRVEALVMFLRLIGHESFALSHTNTHPFTDVSSWADSQVAYAYDNSYTQGTSDTEFSSLRIISDLEYYTFILRALGYEDNVDFTWSTAYEKAVEVGIISQSFERLSELERGQMIYISYKALDTNIKNQNYTLAERLIQESIIDQELYFRIKASLE